MLRDGAPELDNVNLHWRDWTSYTDLKTLSCLRKWFKCRTIWTHLPCFAPYSCHFRNFFGYLFSHLFDHYLMVSGSADQSNPRIIKEVAASGGRERWQLRLSMFFCFDWPVGTEPLKKVVKNLWKNLQNKSIKNFVHSGTTRSIVTL